MTDYKSLTSTDFDTEVQNKVALQAGDSIKTNALLNDYERTLETEDAAQDVIKDSAEVDVRTAEDFIRTLQIHKNYILNEMITLHDANPSDFSELHMTSREFILALSPLLFIQAR